MVRPGLSLLLFFFLLMAVPLVSYSYFSIMAFNDLLILSGILSFCISEARCEQGITALA